MELIGRNRILSNCKVRKLSKDEFVSTFDCGDSDLNDFLLNEALPYRKSKLAVTYILEDKTTEEVFAFFSLANDRISIVDFENNTQFNRFRKQRFANPKRMKSYPAVKICRLGVANSFQGAGIGTIILNFIKGYFTDDNKTGCRFITVDSYASALAFYLRNGFAPLSAEDESADTRLLYFDLDELE